MHAKHNLQICLLTGYDIFQMYAQYLEMSTYLTRYTRGKLREPGMKPRIMSPVKARESW